MNRLVLLGLLALLGSACDKGSPAAAYASDVEALKRGKSIFVGTCGGYCHSTTPGPRDAPYLFDCVWKNGDRDEDIFAVIADGVPNTRMVSFRGALPDGDEDIWKLVAFIRAAGSDC